MAADKDMNEQPHQLVVTVEKYGRYASVHYAVKCPYEPDDIRECGLIEQCNGTHAEVEKNGCRLYPEMPKFPEGFNHLSDDLPEDFVQAFRAWEDDVEEWKDEHIYYGEGYGHRKGECWFTHILAEGDVEPEVILEAIPDGTPIVSPILVEVAFEGAYDETEPRFTLWKENADADAQS